MALDSSAAVATPDRSAVTGLPSLRFRVRVSLSVAYDALVSTASVSAAIAVLIAVATSELVVRPDRSAVTGPPSDRVSVRILVSAANDAPVTVVPVTSARAALMALDSSAAVATPDRSAVTGLPSLRFRVRVSLSVAYDALVSTASVSAAIAVLIAVATSELVVRPDRFAVTGPPSDRVSVRVWVSAANDAPVTVVPVTSARAALMALDSSAAVATPDRSAVTGLPSLRFRVRVSLSVAYDALVSTASVSAAIAVLIAVATSELVVRPDRSAVTGSLSNSVSVSVSVSAE